MYEMTNDEFIDIVNNVLERHAPLKYKYLRANDAPFIHKELRKAVILRSKFLNRFNRKKRNLRRLRTKSKETYLLTFSEKLNRITILISIHVILQIRRNSGRL